jgi:predicted DNA-binding transcriptional regulator AlpA
MGKMITTVDPISIIGIPEVTERTGYSRRQLMRMLAEDTKEKAPGRRFPAPMRMREGSNRLEWREKTIVEWLESRER